MLDRHYRLLFWKRAAIISVPLLVVAGLAWWALPEQEATDTAAPIVSPASTIEQDISRQSETAAYTTEVESSSETSPAGPDEASSITNDATSSVSSVESTSSKEVASISQRPEMGSASASAPSSNVDEAPEGATHQRSQTDPVFSATSKNDDSRNLGIETISASEVDLSLDLMPTFNINGIGAGNAQGILGRDKLKKEKPAFASPRWEVKLGAGLLGASSVERIQGSNATGYFISANGAYRLKERLFASVGLVYNERSAVIRNFNVYDGDRSLLIQGIGYLDIPLQIGYRLGARHSITFGMIFSPLARVKQEEGIRSIPQIPAPYTESVRGHKPGFASFDAAGTLGYQFQLSERFFANAQLRYGLFDVTDDEFYMTGDQDDRNHQIRIGLSYRIINR